MRQWLTHNFSQGYYPTTRIRFCPVRLVCREAELQLRTPRTLAHKMYEQACPRKIAGSCRRPNRTKCALSAGKPDSRRIQGEFPPAQSIACHHRAQSPKAVPGKPPKVLHRPVLFDPLRLPWKTNASGHWILAARWRESRARGGSVSSPLDPGYGVGAWSPNPSRLETPTSISGTPQGRPSGEARAHRVSPLNCNIPSEIELSQGF